MIIMRKIDVDEALVITLYQQGLYLRELALRFGCSRHAIQNVLIRNQVKRRGHGDHHACKRNTILTQHEKEVIDGLLLSDASLQRRSATARFGLVTIHKEFSQHVSELLSVKSKFYYKEAHEGTCKGVPVHSKESYPLYTLRDIAFNELHEKWYPNGKKIVPEYLKLSPTIVKYWFYGDGCSSYVGLNSVKLKFSTESFTLTECKRLTNMLSMMSGAKFTPYKVRADQYVLACQRMQCVNLFFDYIGQSDLKCFDYKWKRPRNYLGRLPK